jgi:hypothetical protein
VEKGLRTKFNGLILKKKNKFRNVLECLKTEALTGTTEYDTEVWKALNCTALQCVQ